MVGMMSERAALMSGRGRGGKKTTVALPGTAVTSAASLANQTGSAGTMTAVRGRTDPAKLQALTDKYTVMLKKDPIVKSDVKYYPRFQDRMADVAQRITSMGGTLPKLPTTTTTTTTTPINNPLGEGPGFAKGGLVKKRKKSVASVIPQRKKNAMGAKAGISKSPGRGYK